MASRGLELEAIELLCELRTAFVRFGEEVRRQTAAADTQIKRAEAWLEERVLHWQRRKEQAKRRLAGARSDLARCESSGTRDRDGNYQPPNCSSEKVAVRRAEEHLQFCERNLRTARQWRNRVERTTTECARELRRLDQLAGTHTRRAAAELGELAHKYTAVQHAENVAGEVSMSSDAGVGRTTTRKQVPPSGAGHSGDTSDVGPYSRLEALVQRLEDIEWLQPEKWKQLDRYQRRVALDRAGRALQDVYDSPRPPVLLVDGDDPRELGGYSPSEYLVAINRLARKNDRLLGSDGIEALRTYLHEFRHSYQDEEIAKLNGFAHLANDRIQAEEWRTNWGEGYIRPEEDFDAYQSQPVEQDADAFANQVIELLFGQQPD